jgi:copper(I)-binding protein
MKIIFSLGYKFIFIVLIGFSALNADGMNSQKQKASVDVLDSWIRLTPAVATNSAAYFTLQNNKKTSITVVEVTTEIAETAAMHDVEIKNSMVRMVHLPKLTIPAGGKVVFEPGGKHLMLINLTKKIEPNQEVIVIFMLANGEQISSKMHVSRQAPSPSNKPENKSAETAEHHH